MIPMSSNNASLPASVPAFIAKLWHMVSDESCDNLICWSKDGTSFIISNQVRFCSHLLPRYYKHNNMASFIRQLNKYGFHKVSSIESSSLRGEKVDHEFAHEFFVKGCAKSLEMIKRKMTTNSREIVDVNGDMAPLLQQLLIQVQDLKDNHETFEAKISSMKRENDALWREHSVLRQKYVKQQKMINQLIQFLVTLVQQQTRGVNTNRSRGVPIILKDLVPTPLMAIEAKKKDSPEISEVDSSSNPSDSNAPLSTKYIFKGGDTLTTSPKSYLINSPIDPNTIDQSDAKRVLFTTLGSPRDDAPVEIISDPAGDWSSIIWCNEPSSSGIGTLGSPTSFSNVNTTNSAKVANLSICPQDVTPPIISRGTIATKETSGLERVSSKSPVKKPRMINIAMKEEKMDPLLSQPSDILNFEGLSPDLNRGDNQRKRKIKEEEPSSSLVLSEAGPRHDLENHLDVVQTDLESLKDILQGLDTSAFMSLFNEQDPLGLNMSDGINKQQLVSFSPNIIDMSDLFSEEDTEDLPPSPIDLSGMDSLLNTPRQLSPSPSAEPHFIAPKKMKK